jgi:hypothetical protein
LGNERNHPLCALKGQYYVWTAMATCQENGETEKTTVYRAFSPPIVVVYFVPKALPLGWVINGFQPIRMGAGYRNDSSVK